LTKTGKLLFLSGKSKYQMGVAVAGAAVHIIQMSRSLRLFRQLRSLRYVSCVAYVACVALAGNPALLGHSHRSIYKYHSLTAETSCPFV